MMILYLLLLFGIALIWTIWGLRHYGHEAQKSPKHTKREGSILFLKGRVKHYGEGNSNSKQRK